MFTDGRSKKVVLLAHCILNQNAISDATAVFPSANQPIVRMLLDAEVGIVQMPCPELCCLGLDRGNIHGGEFPVVVENTRIRAEMQRSPAAERLSALVDQVLLQIREYLKNGFEVLGIIGVNRSPCCGVDTTSDQNRELTGQGVFITALQEQLAANGFSIPVVGIKADPEDLDRVKALL